MMCHEDTELTKNRDGRVVSLYVDLGRYEGSIHGQAGLSCIDCHQDLDGVEFPHAEQLAPVDCAVCHDDVAEGLRREPARAGRRRRRALRAALLGLSRGPRHPAADRRRIETSTKFNIPFMCGRCHKEGSPVAEMYDIPQDSILTHYSFSIHGEGLFKRGLTISAVCTDCHTAHSVLPHTDPRSTIFRDNVARTCQACHGRIEQVHQKVIRGELWEKEPNKVPVCVECHEPHKARRVFLRRGDERSRVPGLPLPPGSAHGARRRDRRSLRGRGGTARLGAPERALRPVPHRRDPPRWSGPAPPWPPRVDCSICHAEPVAVYATSIHGKLHDRGDPEAPDCRHCHGTHGIKLKLDPLSPTYVQKTSPSCVPSATARAASPTSATTAPWTTWSRTTNHSVHGRALSESGLVVSATCTDCHTAHQALPQDDRKSSIHRANIAATCAACHSGIYETFKGSIHFTGHAKDGAELPMCNDCHSSHEITRTDAEGFMREIVTTCGKCHEDVTESYFETFHGKVVQAGLHRDRQVPGLPRRPSDPAAETIPTRPCPRENIVETCAKCHPGSHRQFAGYLTHATHHDRDKYPFIYWTWLFMTSLLVGTFAFFGIHTLLWLPPLLPGPAPRAEAAGRVAGAGVPAIRPPAPLPAHPGHRQLPGAGRDRHDPQVLLPAVGPVALAPAGRLPERGPDPPPVRPDHLLLLRPPHRRHRLPQAPGRALLAGVPGRAATPCCPRRSTCRSSGRPSGGSSAWGRAPRYGRWTYWEKFDYFAVFWGVGMIGFSGLILWFPEFFTHFLPGWFVNVATIIHSDEALLATGFIFTVHFFNTHFRPDKFPMDPVIFTGRIPLEEFKEDRPREYEELVARG